MTEEKQNPTIEQLKKEIREAEIVNRAKEYEKKGKKTKDRKINSL